MLSDHLSKLLTNNLEYDPTKSQINAINSLAKYIIDPDLTKIFLLKGYAGTGKTTLVKSLVKTLDVFKLKTILLAPTGRAAKVLSAYTAKSAYTIHKIIYRQKSSKDGFGKFGLNFNKSKDTVFIVDEASMINNSSYDSSIFGSGNLLDDMLKFVSSGTRCRLILIGDTAQLPPVKLDISPALDKNELEKYGYTVIQEILKDIVRQTKESGILYNATIIRNMIDSGEEGFPQLVIDAFPDIEILSGNDLIEKIDSEYSKTGHDEVIIINKSNKWANKYNQGIRNKVLWKEDEISPGDMLMVVKNNYFWLGENENTDFIANGDIVKLLKIKSIETLYGFRFADAVIELPDYNNISIDTKLILDTLSSESASLGNDLMKNLYYSIAEDYPEIKNKRKLRDKILENEYFNALQVKFAYAVTCHKSQGGQWNTVFIDHGYLTDDMMNTEFLRWMYTAFTRPTNKLYLVNFNKKFFGEK